MEKFVHLHVHTEFSLLDGCARIKNLVAEVKSRGWNAVAMTDHGNMYGALQFYKTCLENDIKPIIGTEFYICDDITKKQGKADMGHLVLLAKNNQGYKNLLKLNSIAFVDGFYYKPRIDYKLLEQYSEGLICLSACLAGHIPQFILSRRFDEADNLALKMKNMFADGDFYLEIQNHDLPEQKEVNTYLSAMSDKLGIKLVATNDVHYIKKEDAEMQDVLMCVQMGKKLEDQDRLKFQSEEFYLKTYEEMLLALPEYEEALKTTLEIADKCELIIRSKAHDEIPGIDSKYILPATENFIPKYSAPDEMDNFEYLRKLTFDGLNKKYNKLTPEILGRAESELKIIHDLGFVEYFLVVWDYINFARCSGIPVGPGRGSGAGSLVAYAISITLVDPLRYDLIFERFIHKERVSMPDFDIDFDCERRSEVLDYVKGKYTPQNIAQIITFGTMAAKNAIRDVGRVLSIPISETDKISKMIPTKLPDGIKKPPVLKYYFGLTGKEENEKYVLPELRDLYNSDENIKRMVNLASKLEGMPRNSSTHACGVLIAPEPVDTFVPLARNGEDISTQFQAVELESLGLLKMDFLGLITLTDINKAVQMVKQTKGIDIDFYSKENIACSDKNVYDLIATGNTEAIFQLESGGFKKFMKDLRPDCLEDIIAGVSLYRPGPMDSIPKYIENKHNPDQIVYPHPCLEPILNVTYGCIVYQEQVMKICQVMGGYSLGQADNVRRIMSKKKKDKMALEKEKFINGWEDPKGEKSIPGALKLGVPKEVAEAVFADMETFASYAFNKSHAAAYAHLTYQTAYLKCYHKVEFLAAVLNNRITSADTVRKYVTYAKKEKIQVFPPHINKSSTFFTVENGNLRFGLSALKNVGIAVIENIVSEREKNGDYKDFLDFAKRVDSLALNKRCLESLIISGAFDCFKVTRSQLMAVYENAVERVLKDKKNRASGQFSLFDDGGNSDLDKISYPDIKEYNKETMLKFEKEIVGSYISGHPLDDYIDKFQEFTFISDMIQTDEEQQIEDEYEIEQDTENALKDGMQVRCGGIISEVKKIPTKSNKEMAFVKIEDLYGTFEVTFFAYNYAKYKNILVEDSLVTVVGKVSLRDGKSPSIIGDSVTQWNTQKTEEIREIKTLWLKFDMNNEELYSKCMKICDTYRGDDTVCIKNTSDDKRYKITKTVDAGNYIINEFNGLIGEENVFVKKG